MESKIRILIVDDESQILKVYKDFLEKRNYYVDTASNGEEGFAKLDSNEYDIAIVDIQMPKLDGLQLAKKIQDKGIDVEVIILTGHGDKDHAIEAINLHVGGWFEKARIDFDKLHEKIKELSQPIADYELKKIFSKINEDIEKEK